MNLGSFYGKYFQCRKKEDSESTVAEEMNKIIKAQSCLKASMIKRMRGKIDEDAEVTYESYDDGEDDVFSGDDDEVRSFGKVHEEGYQRGDNIATVEGASTHKPPLKKKKKIRSSGSHIVTWIIK